MRYCLLTLVFVLFLFEAKASGPPTRTAMLKVHDSLSHRAYVFRLRRTMMSIRLTPERGKPNRIIKDYIFSVDSNGFQTRENGFVPFRNVYSIHFKEYSRFQWITNATLGCLCFQAFLYTVFADNSEAATATALIFQGTPIANIYMSAARKRVTIFNVNKLSFSP